MALNEALETLTDREEKYKNALRLFDGRNILRRSRKSLVLQENVLDKLSQSTVN